MAKVYLVSGDCLNSEIPIPAIIYVMVILCYTLGLVSLEHADVHWAAVYLIYLWFTSTSLERGIQLRRWLVVEAADAPVLWHASRARFNRAWLMEF